MKPLNQCTCTTLQQQICSFCSNRFRGLYVHKCFIIVLNLGCKGIALLHIFQIYIQQNKEKAQYKLYFNKRLKLENIYVLCNASTSNVMFAINSLTEMANKMIPKNLRII